MAEEEIGAGEWLDKSYKRGQAIPYTTSAKSPERMTLQDMLKMPLNNYVCGRHYTIMRVPGGWIYDGKQDIFVPEPN